MLSFTLYPNHADTRGRVLSGSWEWWVQNYFSVHEVRGGPELRHADDDTLNAVKNGQAVVLGVIPDGKPRLKINVTEVHALGLDIDDSDDVGLFSVLSALSEFHYAVYTTFKNGADVACGKPRVRVILPMAKPLDPKNYRQIWLRLNAMVGGASDAQTKDAGRLYYLPATFDRAFAEAWQNCGNRYLSVDDLPVLPSEAPAKRDRDPADALRRVLQRIKHCDRDVLGLPLWTAAKALISGDALAQPGERHDIILKLTWWIAEKERELTEEMLHELFDRSLAVMTAQDEGGHDFFPEVVSGYLGAVEKQRPVDASRAGVSLYTPEEQAEIAAKQRCSVADLEHRWIVQQGDSYFFLQQNGWYSKPGRGPEGRTKAKQELLRAPIALSEIGEKKVRRKTIDELVEEYGFVVDGSVVDLTAQGTWLDMPEKMLHEAPCPARMLVPEPSSEVDEWLQIVAGARYEELLDWLAVFPDLEKSVRALVVHGNPSTGKGLLAQGLARIWTTGAWTSADSMLGDFNEQLANCPLVVGDEKMPSMKDPTVFVRRWIGTGEHEMKRKHRASVTVHGHIRLMMLCNHDNILRVLEQSRHEKDAMVQRTLVLEVSNAAADYLSQFGRDYLDATWLGRDLIAKHVLWLLVTRSAQVKGDRFADTRHKQESETHRRIYTSKWAQAVLQWLIDYCMLPTPLDADPSQKNLIHAGGGEFWVNTSIIVKRWELYQQRSRLEPSTKVIGEALNELFGDRQQRTVAGDRYWFYRVDPARLFEYAHETGHGTKDRINQTVNRGALSVVGGST